MAGKNTLNRLAEAEPLMRRGIEILVKFSAATGHQHPYLQTVLDNYFSILTEMGYEESNAIEKIKSLLPREWIEKSE